MKALRLLFFAGLGCQAVIRAQNPAPPTFAEDIGPLLAENCFTCHRDGGIGPFPLTTYEQVRRRSRQVAEVVASRFMPPWKPLAEHSPPLQGDRSLEQSVIDRIVAWHDAGAPAGDLSAYTPPDPPTQDWELGEPDLVLAFSEPFELGPDGVDDFRNFVLPIALDRPRYVRAVEFHPESSLVIHHVVMGFDDTPESRARDDAEPGPGFAAMDLGGAVNPNGHLLGWTPGQSPYEAPAGTAFELRPGTDLVVQLHLQPSGKPEQVAPRIGLYFTDEPPTRTGFVVLLRENDIDLPPGVTDQPIHQTITLPVDVEVLGLYPHAHYLGNDMRITATLPDGTERGLLHIPDWDFNWQSDYRYAEPLPLPAGTRIDMRYTYDNSAANPRNPHNPPVHVTEGNSSFDEMGSAAIQVVLRDPADLPRLQESWFRYLVDSEGPSADAYFGLANTLEQQERWAEAGDAYEQALALDPTNVRTLNNLAATLEFQGLTDQAIAVYQRAVAVAPTVALPRLNLARLYRATQRPAAAIAVLTEGVALIPRDEELVSDLAGTYWLTGDLPQARATLEAGLDQFARSPRLQLLLGQLLLILGDPAGIDTLERLLAAPPAADSALRYWQAEAAFTLAQLARQQQDLPAFDRRLTQALAFDPDHSRARLLAAARAVAGNAMDVAQTHLLRLLSLPADNRPSENDVLRALPYPSGLRAYAAALVATGQRESALDLLTRAAADARSQDARTANLIEAWRDQL